MNIKQLLISSKDMLFSILLFHHENNEIVNSFPFYFLSKESYSCGPMDCSLQGSSVHGILQTRILVWVAMPSSRGSSQPND